MTNKSHKYNVIKKCPFCAEDILGNATVCRYCKKEIYARKGWKEIIYGALLLISAGLWTLLSACIIGPLAVFVYPAVITVGAYLIIRGIIKLSTPAK